MTDKTSPSADVRMRGFRQRSEVSTVLAWIDRHALRLGNETVPLEEAADRILAADVVAPFDVPAFDRAAMDGYALRGAATAGRASTTRSCSPCSARRSPDSRSPSRSDPMPRSES